MRTKIITEIASSHNGDLSLAKALIKAAAENGADIVKFQDWRASNVSDNDPDKRRYESLEFKEEWYPELIKYCESDGVEFLTTCFNADRAEFLASLGLKKIKLASISLTNTELLMAAGLHFEEIILSTAMHTKEEIKEAIDILASNAQKFTIMCCTANYPLDLKNANLGRIESLEAIVSPYEQASIGYSSHSDSLNVPKVALAMGIKYLEVHFSLSKYLPQIPHRMYKDGPLITTHAVSLEPHQLRELAEWRDTCTLIRGSRDFIMNDVEAKIKEQYSQRYGR